VGAATIPPVSRWVKAGRTSSERSTTASCSVWTVGWDAHAVQNCTASASARLGSAEVGGSW
jgi:hypothetical protein